MRKLAAIFVADLEEAGYELAPAANVWLIRHEGHVVGAVAPLANDSQGEKWGMIPGDIRPAHRAALEILVDEIEDRWHAWLAAIKVVAAVKAVDQ